jgi:hypothetical protein
MCKRHRKVAFLNRSCALRQDAREIHLSYHDGAHYNSVRRADDVGDGAPAPIALGTAPAAPGSGATAAAAASAGAREEERVAQEAGCFHDRAAVRAALAAAGGRVAQARTLRVEVGCAAYPCLDSRFLEPAYVRAVSTEHVGVLRALS